MRKLKLEEYSLLKNEEEFKFKSDNELEEFLSELFEENGLKFVKYLGETHWSRKLMLFQKLWWYAFVKVKLYIVNIYFLSLHKILIVRENLIIKSWMNLYF